MLKGIDVSFAQGRVDWDKLKGNIDFAIIRCGYGNNQANQDDVQWARNVAECNRLGIPWGTYLYSYATSAADAGSEAAHVLRLLKGLNPTYPVYIDMEHDAAFKSRALSTQICKIFCETVSAAGFTAGIYANKDWAVNRLDMAQLSKWTFWLAQYNDKVTYSGKYDMWQYSSSGSLPGITGKVDLNYGYKDFTSAVTPAITGLVLDTGSYDLASGAKYTVLAKCKDKPTVATTGRDVIAVSEPRLDPKGRGWLIDVQGLPPASVVRHGHISVTAGGVTQQCNFNVV